MSVYTLLVTEELSTVTNTEENGQLWSSYNTNQEYFYL